MDDAELISYDVIVADAWSRLEQAADDPDHPMRLMTLASLDARGRPDARLLVLRGASRENRRLWFHTDRRSKKVTHLQEMPRVCGIAYDRRDGVQLRVYGTATLHHGDEVARQHWQQADFAVRHGYGSPDAPGEPLPRHDPRTQRHRQLMDREDGSAGQENFLVIETDVDKIDWCQVQGPRQRRAVMRAESDWTVEPVAP